MKVKPIGLAISLLAVLLAGEMAFAGIMGNDECRRNCADSYRNCKQKETAASAVDDISCHELREMCIQRCDNISGYVDCKEKCHGDESCLKTCKSEFSSNVKDYRPYLDRHKK
ncbi:exported hypothetical protein [Desulfosarcina cetonica]|uniref:hypothetical protein n=1 Tax=Desulfosarcina cetonica TaxID=90730 RepID=UPI0006D1A137|nr:hypothetical protein [Desulfosarcina cetonica]VTR68070.1 exported hypothetical protein [Desulfosarcina cetonica]